MKWLAILMTAIFVGERLAGVVSWSWWIVLSPLIVYLGFYLLVILLGLLIVSVGSFVDGFKKAWRKK